MKSRITLVIMVLLPTIVFSNFNKRHAEPKEEAHLHFIKNNGQIANKDGIVQKDVLYKASVNNAELFFTKENVIFITREKYFEQTEQSQKEREKGNLEYASQLELKYREYQFELKFNNTNPDVEIMGMDKSTVHSNYYLGHCQDGIMRVPHYKSIEYTDIYPNIDLKFYSNSKGMKFDFIVKPGGDPNMISYTYEDVESLEKDENGNIKVSSPFLNFTEEAPYSYTLETGEEVESSFLISEKGKVSFNLEDYPKEKTLIIDPTLDMVWSTYFDIGGSSTWDNVSFNSTGDFYVACYHYSSVVDVFNNGGYYQGADAGGTTDLAIIKFSNAGAQLWTTYYGGTGNEYLICNTTEVDANNNLYVGGESSSKATFPLQDAGGYYNSTPPPGNCGFLLKFDNDCNRLWGTFIGASGARVRGITTASNSDVYIVGACYDYAALPVQDQGGGAYYQPVHGGGDNGYIMRFNSSTTKLWCTYFGGDCYVNFMDIHIDPTNNYLYCVGELGGWSAPASYPPLTNPGGGAYYDATVNGKQDLFIARFNSSRALTWSTIYGGLYNDNVNGDCGSIATDSYSNFYFCGKTASDNLPLQDPGGGAYYQPTIGGNGVGDSNNDGFILKFNSSGVRQWATYYGGAGNEEMRKIKIDKNDLIWCAGFTTDASVPLMTATDHYNQTFAGGTDGMIIRFDNSGVREWASCLGGTDGETIRPFGIYEPNTSTVELFMTDYTASTDFPTVDPGGAYYIAARPTASSAYITKFSYSVCEPIAITSQPSPASQTICDGNTANYSVTVTGGTPITYQWKLNGGDIGGATSSSYTASVSGAYTCVITNPCSSETTTSVTLTIANPVDGGTINGTQSICSGADPAVLGNASSPSGGIGAWTYEWEYQDNCSGGWVVIGSSNSLTYDPPSGLTGTRCYRRSATNSCGSDYSNTITVTVNPNPTPVISGDNDVCAKEMVSYSTPNVGGNTYSWVVTNGTPTSGTGNTIDVTWGNGGIGTLVVTEIVTATGCQTVTGSYTVTINANPIPLISGSTEACENQTFTYSTPNTGGNTYSWVVTNGTPTSGTGNTIDVTWGAAGSGTLVVTETVTATGCFAFTNPYSVTINANPTPVVSGNTSACETEQVNYSTPNVGGNTYSWSVTGGTPTSGSGNTIDATWGSAGAGTLIVTETVTATGCQTVTASYPVTINANPTPVISGNTIACETEQVTYSTPNVGGNTYSWSVTGGTPTSGSGNTIDVTWGTAGAGTLIVTEAVTATGCQTVTASYPVTINANPTPVISGNTSVCETEQVTYSTPNVGGNTYSWSVTGGTPTSGSGNTIDVTWGSAGAGTLIITETVTATGCQTSTSSYNVTINPEPTPVISGSNSVCENELVSYSTPNVGGNTYSWTVTGGTPTSGSGNTIDVTWGSAGAGTLIVTEAVTATGCQASTSTYNVTINAEPTPSISGNNTACENEQVSYSTPNVGGNTYSWAITGGTPVSGTGNTIDVTWGTTGLGTVTLTETITATGCQVTTNPYNVGINPAPTPVISGDNTACENETVTYSTPLVGGNTYSWSVTGGTPASGTGNTIDVTWGSGGVGTLTVTEIITSTWCQVTTNAYNVNIDAAPVANAGADDIIPFGTSTTLNGSEDSGAGGPYSFSWTPVDSLVDANLEDPVTENLHTVIEFILTVTDNTTGCTDTSGVIIQVSGGPLGVSILEDTTEICIGDQVQLNATGSNGEPAGYVYSWTSTPGSVIPSVSNPTVSPSVTTEYVVVLDDGFSSVSDTITIIVNDLPVISGSMNDTICYGDNVTLDASLSTGASPISYNWNSGAGTDSVFSIVINDTTSIYLTITDNNGCISSDSMTVSPHPLPVADAGVDTAICLGTKIILDAALSSGNAPLIYEWDIPATGISPQVEPDTTTIYTVTVTDTYGCFDTADVEVVVHDLPIANAGVNDTIPFGTPASLDGSEDSGIGGPYSYSWVPSDSLVDANVEDPVTINLFNNTEFILFVADNVTGCVGTDTTMVITTGGPLTVTILNDTTEICLGDQVQLNAIGTGGESSGYAYTWESDPVSVISPFPDAAVSPTVTTQYIVFLTDAYNIVSDTITIVVNDLPVINESMSDTICSGDNVTIDASSSTGAAPLSYNWNNNAGTDSVFSVVVIDTTTIYLTITDINGCSSTDTMIAYPNIAPVANAGVDSVICFGSIINLDAGLSSGNAPLSYSWDIPATGQSPQVEPATTTQYNVTVTDGFGCTDTDVVEIAVNDLPVAFAGNDTAICIGESVVLDASGSTGNPVLGFTWDNGLGSGVTHTVTPNDSITYTVSVTDGNGCVSEDDIFITISDPPIANAGLNDTICSGDSTIINASGGSSYSWSNGNTSQSQQVSPLVTTEYIVTVTDAIGCIAWDSVTIVVKESPEIFGINLTDATCFNSTDGSIDITVINGVSPYTYIWSNSSSNEDLTDIGSGSYTVIVTGSNNCTISQTFLINEPESIDLSATIYNISCYGNDDGQISLNVTGGTSPYSFQWDANAGNSTNASVTGLTAGTFSVTVTDDIGCQKTSLLEIVSPPDGLSYTISSQSVNCYNSSDGQALISVQGGSPPYSFFWNDSQIASDSLVTNLEAGQNTVTIVDNSTCSLIDTFYVENKDQMIASFLTEIVTCTGNDDGSIRMDTIYGGTPPYYLDWNNGETSQILTGLTSGTYIVEISDTLGCMIIDTVEVTGLEGECLFIPNVFTPNDDPANDVWEILNIDLYPDAVVEIFNRWGDLMYRSDRYHTEPWDGTYQGRNAPLGSYIYIVNLDGTRVYDGVVTIIR